MKPLARIPMRNGLLAGVLGICLLTGLYFMDRHPFLIPVYMDFRILLFGVFIFFTLREVRDYHFGGVLYFWQGLIGAFLFTFTYAAVSFVALLILIYAVPAFLSDYISLSIARLKAFPADLVEQVGKDFHARNLELLPATNATDLAVLHATQSFAISLFISIILSVILRKQPQP